MLRAATLGGAIALALLVASCSSEGSPPSYTALYLEPYDLSTGADRTGVDHPQLVINGRSWEELQFGDAEFLTNALSISTLPEGRAVEIVAEAVNHGSGGIGIDITPRVPFEERWYAVRLHLGDRASHYTVLPALAPGASPVDTVNRFYNGSLPLLRVYSGGEDAGVIRVGVGATEALQLPDELQVPAVSQHRFGVQLAGLQPELLQACYLPLGKLLVGEVLERRSAP